MTRQIVLDTETTGLSAEGGDRIIEIGCVELLARKLTGNNKHFYLNPERESHEDALKVHGISNEFLLDKPKFAAVAPELIEYLRDAEIIIHNAAFDVGFLNKELELAGHPPLQHFVACITDTLAMAKELFPGVDNSSRTLHGALLDAELLADVYIYLTRGQDALLVLDEVQEGAGTGDARIDLRGFALPVLRASAQELAAHEEVLAQIDKASGGKTVWRALP